MINPVYNLPSLSFVGGETQSFLFNLKTAAGNEYDATGCSVAFAIINYTNKNGVPILTKTVSLTTGPDGGLSYGLVDLLPEDTVGLHGRYVYQVSIKDAKGETEIPGQGLIDITRNIHPGFIK